MKPQTKSKKRVMAYEFIKFVKEAISYHPHLKLLKISIDDGEGVSTSTAIKATRPRRK